MRGKLMQMVVCAGALCLALAGCGGNDADKAPATTDAESEAAAAEEQQAEPEVDDEALIKADFTDRFEKSFSHEFLKSSVDLDEEEEATFEAIGMTLDEYIELTRALVIANPTKAEVKGDEATLTVELTLPDWETADEQGVVEKLLEEKSGGKDVSEMTEEEFTTIFGETMREAMTYPTMPSMVEEFTVAYQKTGDTWAPVDEGDITNIMMSAEEDAGEFWTGVPLAARRGGIVSVRARICEAAPRGSTL